MKPLFSRLPAPSLPRAADLQDALKRVLGDWAFLSAQPLGRPVAGPSPQSLEFSLPLRCESPCRLVLRSSPELGMELARQATGDPGAGEYWIDAFRELCSLVAAELGVVPAAEEERRRGAFLPQPSTPELWPAREPDAEVAVGVGVYVIEARIWAEARA
jgi:hypothetical protein